MSMPKLPSFEGSIPDDVTVHLTGAAELEGPLARASHLDEVTYAVVRVVTSKIAHSVDKDGDLHRVETMKLDGLAIFTDTGEASELITRLNREAREAAGIFELPGLGEAVDVEVTVG